MVDAAAPEAVRFITWDTELKGFGLRVEPSGVKSYIVRYRVGGGRRGVLRQFKIGTHGKLTSEQARDQATRVLAQAELGADPQGERAGGRAALTVAELCDLYMSEGVTTKKASTLALDRVRIARHIKPQIGHRRITEITRADLERLMEDVASGKVREAATARTRGGKGAASRTISLTTAIFAFAVGRKLVSENPGRGIKRFKDRKRERFLSPKELGRLGEVLEAEEACGGIAEHLNIIRLLALTGARKNEIARLVWNEVDFDRSCLRLDDSKTGQKVVPLGEHAKSILAQVAEKGRAGVYVFPDARRRNEPVRGLDWAWVRIRTAAGLEDVRIHDLRHSFASAGLGAGHGLALLGRLLSHGHVATTARYAHLADDPVKAAADQISGTIAAAMSRKVSSEAEPQP